ncbi:hypothetical protein Rs2_35585 [Raphanus sativus]|nr:hypothetical protein Rs2_35585 [Raphanus sativus]
MHQSTFINHPHPRKQGDNVDCSKSRRQQQENSQQPIDRQQDTSTDNDPNESIKDWENDYYDPEDAVKISKRRYGPFNATQDAYYKAEVDPDYGHLKPKSLRFHGKMLQKFWLWPIHQTTSSFNNAVIQKACGAGTRFYRRKKLRTQPSIDSNVKPSVDISIKLSITNSIRKLIDKKVSPSIDIHYEFGTRAYDQNIKRYLCWKTSEEVEHRYEQASSGKRRDICNHSRLELELYNKY